MIHVVEVVRSELSEKSCQGTVWSVGRSGSQSATSYINVWECAKPGCESLEECANVPSEGPGRASHAVGPKCAENYEFAFAEGLINARVCACILPAHLSTHLCGVSGGRYTSSNVSYNHIRPHSYQGLREYCAATMYLYRRLSEA